MSVVQRIEGMAPTAPSMISGHANITAKVDQSYFNLRCALGEDAKQLDCIPINDVVIETLRNDDIPMEDRKKKDGPILRYKMRIGWWKNEDDQKSSPTVWSYLTFVNRGTLPHVNYLKERKRLRRTEKVKCYDALKYTEMEHLDGRPYDRPLRHFIIVCFVLKQVPMPELSQFPGDFRITFRNAIRALRKENNVEPKANLTLENYTNWSRDLPDPTCTPDRHITSTNKSVLRDSSTGAKQAENLRRLPENQHQPGSSNNISSGVSSRLVSLRVPQRQPHDSPTTLVQNVNGDAEQSGDMDAFLQDMFSSCSNSEVSTGPSESDSETHRQAVGSSHTQQFPSATSHGEPVTDAAAINHALQSALEPVRSLIKKRKADEEELISSRNKRIAEEGKLSESQNEITRLESEETRLHQQLEVIRAQAAAKRAAREIAETDLKAMYEALEELQNRVKESHDDEMEMLAGLEWLKEKP